MLIFISCRRWDLSKKELDVSSLHEKPGFQVPGALQGVRGDTCWAHYDTKLWLITDKMSITGNLSTCSPGIALRCNLPHPYCPPSACRFCGTVAESCSLSSRGIEMLSFTHPPFFFSRQCQSFMTCAPAQCLVPPCWCKLWDLQTTPALGEQHAWRRGSRGSRTCPPAWRPMLKGKATVEAQQDPPGCRDGCQTLTSLILLLQRLGGTST